MNSVLSSRWVLQLGALVGWVASGVAQNQPPTVSIPLANLTARPGTGSTQIQLAATFRDPDLVDLAGTQVRIATTLGTVNLELFDARVPGTVTNFLRYITAGRYQNLFWHRVTKTNSPFVQTIDTGAFTFTTAPSSVPAFPPVPNAFGVSNVRGTVAMNRTSGDPDSATSSWFVNVGNNSTLLDVFDGGFTVFGRVIEGGLNVADAIFALPTTNAGPPFDALPVRNFTSGPVQAANLIFLDSFAVGPKIMIGINSASPSIVSVQVTGFTANLSFGAGPGTSRVTLTATDFNGASVSTGFDVTVSETAPIAHLANISTRAFVGTSDNVLIGGFVVRGDTPKRIIVRAIGPSLTQFGVAGALSDPVVRIVNSQGVTLAQNDNWRATQEAEIQASGFPPSNDLDAAVIVTLPPGPYTAIVSGAGGATGVALVEAYELDLAEAPRLINISSRGFVATGDGVMIGGFVIGGTSPKKVIVRAVGPTLAQFGVNGALANPTLEIYRGGELIAQNDDWQIAPAGGPNPDRDAIAGSGFMPANTLESAVLRTLVPGPYTAIVRGAGGSQGVALVEVYDLE